MSGLSITAPACSTRALMFALLSILVPFKHQAASCLAAEHAQCASATWQPHWWLKVGPLGLAAAETRLHHSWAPAPRLRTGHLRPGTAAAPAWRQASGHACSQQPGLHMRGPAHLAALHVQHVVGAHNQHALKVALQLVRVGLDDWLPADGSHLEAERAQLHQPVQVGVPAHRARADVSPACPAAGSWTEARPGAHLLVRQCTMASSTLVPSGCCHTTGFPDSLACWASSPVSAAICRQHALSAPACRLLTPLRDHNPQGPYLVCI